MFRFRMDIAGEVQMDRGIARFSEGVADYRPIWPIIEDEFYIEEKDQFRSEGRAGGDRWRPLSDLYGLWKEIAYPGVPIMQREGDLINSLTKPNDPNGVRIEARKTLTLGTTIPYAIYHQSTKPRKKNKFGKDRLPRRPVIMLTEAFKRAVMRHFQGYLIGVATEAGFRSGWTPGTAESLSAVLGRGKSLPYRFHGASFATSR